MSLGPSGRIYYAVPQNKLVNVNGDVRPLYAAICGEAGNNRVAVPQNATATVGSDTRPVYGTAGVVDGQLSAGEVVVAVPQGYMANVGGDVRPVYGFVGCPGGSSSSSSSASGSGSGGSGSGSSSSDTISNPCCVPHLLPATLYVTIPGATCQATCPSGGGVQLINVNVPGGTYAITYDPTGATWVACYSLGVSCPNPYGAYQIGLVFFFICNQPLLGAQGFLFNCNLNTYSTSGGCLVCSTTPSCVFSSDSVFSVSGGGWATAQCNPPYWYSGSQTACGGSFSAVVTA